MILIDKKDNAVNITQEVISPYGQGELGIAIVLDYPSETELRVNKLLTDKRGLLIKRIFGSMGIDIEKGCKTFVALQSAYGGPNPSAKLYREGLEILNNHLNEMYPELIICFGRDAIKAILEDSPSGLAITDNTCHGRIIPSDYRNALIACTYDPCDVESNYSHIVNDLVYDALEKYSNEGYKCKKLNESEGNSIIWNMSDAKELFQKLMTYDKPVSFDYEASGLNFYSKDYKLLTASFAFSENEAYCLPLMHKESPFLNNINEIYELLKMWLISDKPKIIQNFEYEEMASRVVLGVQIKNCILDTMIREHILDNRNKVTGQKFQCYVRYGSVYASEINQAILSDYPLDVVCDYNNLDTRYNYKWSKDQELEMDDALRNAYSLFHNALYALVNFKERGVKIDYEILKNLKKDVEEEIADLEYVEKNASFLKEYKEKFDQDFSSGSYQRKQRLYFDLLGLKPLKVTTTGQKKEKTIDDLDYVATDEETMEYLIEQVDRDSEIGKFIRAGIDVAKLNKLNGTYISLFEKLCDENGYIHPSFLLHLVSTYRSSSADPNFQNIPIRNPVLARIRKAIVPRNDSFLECDYGANEVKYIATIANDKQLIEDCNNGVDFHRYFASLLYEKDESEIDKKERYQGKNGFVFPEFYGSYFKSIARKYSNWNIDVIKETEDIFWKRYGSVKKWQFSLYNDYIKNGYIETPLGFRLKYGKAGMMSRNNLANSPIQSTAFHRLLWAVTYLDAEMVEMGFNSIIVGQIHDSVVIDLDESERDIVIGLLKKWMLCDAWEWDDKVSKEIEIKIGPNLLDLKEIEI